MSQLPIELYKVEQIRALEQIAFQTIPEDILMERAGNAAYASLVDTFEEFDSVIVICGKGNNGGDGYVLARMAHADGLDVEVYHLGEIDQLPPSAAKAEQACRAAGVTIKPFDSKQHLEADIIVDAVLGIGLKGDVHGEALDAINAMNNSLAEVIALDVPSGLDADTGDVLGAAVMASMTVTFIGVKQGLLTGEAVDYVGDIICQDLDIGDDAFSEIPISAYRTELIDVQDALPVRSRDAHKGDFGHILIVGGDYGMPGAVRMAGEAALRSGAGLVSVATRPEHIAAVCASRPELMTYGIQQVDELKALIEKADVIVLGPGLGQSDWSRQCFDAVMAVDKPMIVDASALHLLADKPSQRDHWILTPHPGEAAKLLACSTQDVQIDRFSAAAALQEKYQGVVILKGAGTIIQGPDHIPEICDAGNPGMATAGMGDVLSGLIAAMVGQDFPLIEAARIGVCLHAHAGDAAAADGERGLLATDLFTPLRQLLNASDEETVLDETIAAEDIDALQRILESAEQ